MASSEPAPVFCGPLATPAQLSTSASLQDGVPQPLISSILHAGTHLTLSATILLRLPHSVGAHASILLQRFFTGPKGGSLLNYNVKDISAGAIFLASKLSTELPATPRSIINVFAYLLTLSPPFFAPEADGSKTSARDYYVSEGTYQNRKLDLYDAEAIILKVLGFQTQAPLPFALAVQYVQALGVFEGESGRKVARRAHAHLNTALVSPQLLFLTQPPHVLAVGAVYLAAREQEVKLPEVEGGWWEIFDVEREDLGYMVVSILSMEPWVQAEKEKEGQVPLDREGLKRKLESEND